MAKELSNREQQRIRDHVKRHAKEVGRDVRDAITEGALYLASHGKKWEVAVASGVAAGAASGKWEAAVAAMGGSALVGAVAHRRRNRRLYPPTPVAV